MMKLDGIAAFVATIEAGSISAAARRLGWSKSVVSERLAELERALGTSLVQRTTRKLSLTQDGDSLLPRARRILSDVDEAAAEIVERRGSLAGPLRISAPVSFGVLHLGPAIYAFLAKHPDLELSLELDDRFVDAAADGFDAVIRHGPVVDSRLIAKRLAVTRRTLVASPDYLQRAGTPTSPDDLRTHRGILYSNRDTDWRFASGEGWIVVKPRSCMRVNNGLIMRDAALVGHGITLLPTFFTYSEIASGSLKQIDIGLEAEGAELFVCYPLTRTAPAKVLALVDSLKTAFGAPPYWEPAG